MNAVKIDEVASAPGEALLNSPFQGSWFPRAPRPYSLGNRGTC